VPLLDAKEQGLRARNRKSRRVRVEIADGLSAEEDSVTFTPREEQSLVVDDCRSV
jgi:hypothetical protein